MIVPLRVLMTAEGDDEEVRVLEHPEQVLPERVYAVRIYFYDTELDLVHALHLHALRRDFMGVTEIGRMIYGTPTDEDVETLRAIRGAIDDLLGES
jgi:hypothetical protein